MYGRPQLTWHKSGADWALHIQGRRGAMLHVVPDAVYPGMWRVKRPDGSLSDMANLSPTSPTGCDFHDFRGV
jgi:hypothetical protein